MTETTTTPSKKSSLFCCGCGDRDTDKEHLVTVVPRNPEGNIKKKEVIVIGRTQSIAFTDPLTTNANAILQNPPVTFHYNAGKRPLSARANVPVMPFSQSDKKMVNQDILRVSERRVMNPEAGFQLSNNFYKEPPYTMKQEENLFKTDKKIEQRHELIAHQNIQPKPESQNITTTTHQHVTSSHMVAIEQPQSCVPPTKAVRDTTEKFQISKCIPIPSEEKTEKIQVRPHSNHVMTTTKSASIPKIIFTYETPRKSYVQKHFVIPNHLQNCSPITNSHSTAMTSAVTRTQFTGATTTEVNKFKLSDVVHKIHNNVQEILPVYGTPKDLASVRSPKDDLQTNKELLRSEVTPM